MSGGVGSYILSWALELSGQPLTWAVLHLGKELLVFQIGGWLVPRIDMNISLEREVSFPVGNWTMML